MRSLVIIAIAGLAGLLPGEAPRAQHDGPAMNFHRIDDRLATGGHFTDNGIEALVAQGVEVVVDLRDRPPEGQKERLAEHGIEWINVPVVWESPEASDFDRFREVMATYGGDSVLVQCQANYRASAMTYLYRVLDGGVPEAEAREDMNAVWEPSGTWATYIDAILMR
jgi:protein tyrosine phosphatase (PTP) superfamily phosphohydrolase (DUF442 family)